MNNHKDTQKIKSVIADYTEGTYEADIEKIKRAFHPGAVMNGYLGDDFIIGTPQIFIDDIASNPSMKSCGDNYNAEIENIQIDGDIAAVSISQTGFKGSITIVDYFQLIKIDGNWSIIAKIFTTI